MSANAQGTSLANSLQAFEGFIASGQKLKGQVVELCGKAEESVGHGYAYVIDKDGKFAKIALAVGGVFLLYQNTWAVVAGVAGAVLFHDVVSGITEKTVKVWKESNIGAIGVFFTGFLTAYFAPWALAGTVYGAFTADYIRSANEEQQRIEPNQGKLALVLNMITGAKPEKAEKIKKTE